MNFQGDQVTQAHFIVIRIPILAWISAPPC